MKYLKWSEAEIEFLKTCSTNIPTIEIAKKLNRTPMAVAQKRFLVGVKIKKGYGVKTVWNNEMTAFLVNNHQKLTNPQIAAALGLTLTVTRNKIYELGLQRVKYDKWTPEQVQYLRDNFQKIGDVAIATYFNENMPKSYKWTRKMIRKKRHYLGLHRSDDELHKIRHDNATIGNAATMTQNSGSSNLSDNYVATLMAGGSRKLDREFRQKLLLYKPIIELKRNQIKLLRTCQTLQNNQ